MAVEPTPPTAVPPRARQTPVRLVIGCLGLLVVACVGFSVLAVADRRQQQQNYVDGHAAYLAGDCAAASSPLGRAARGEPGSPEADVALQAAAELQACEALLEAEGLERSGQSGAALVAFSAFITQYGDTPLGEAALQQGQALVAAVAPSELINRDVCDSLDALAAQNIIAQPQSQLPGLIFACGQAFERAGNTGAALSFYSRFRANYPNHTLLAEVEVAFVRATIAEAEALGAGDLPAPRAVGASTGTGGLVTVVIQNDSPEVLSVVFKGPDVRVEELGSCAECARFSSSTPAACPAIGPVGTYTLAPGTYDVVVKASGDGRVTPFRGTWTLEGGREYASCFYLVRQQ